MGQNIRMVEETVINLENQQLISLRQAQNFIEDYHNKTELIKDVGSFMDSPSLSLFLKYYISNKYPNENNLVVISQDNILKVQESQQNISKFSDKTLFTKKQGKDGKDFEKTNQSIESDRNMNEERAKIQAQLIQYIIQQIQQKIVNQYQAMENIIQQTYKILYDVLINNKTYQIKTILMEQTRVALEMANITLIEYDYYTETIQKYDQDLCFYENFRKNASEFALILQQYFSESDKNRVSVHETSSDSHKQERPRIRIKCTRGSKDGLIEFVDNKNTLVGMLIEGGQFSDNFQETSEIVVRSLMDEFFEESYLKSEQQKIKIFFVLMLSILDLSLKMREKVVRIRCKQLLSLSKIDQDEIISVILKNFMKKQNIQLKTSHKSLLLDISKHSKRIKRQFMNIKLYLEKIEDQKLSYFMDYDRYGELKFCYGEINENLMIKMKNIWRGNKIKIIDIMTEYHSVIHHFRQAIKGNFKPGVKQEQFDQVKCRTFINSNQILDRLHLEIAKTRKIKKTSQSDSYWVFFQSEDEGPEEKRETTLQEELIRDLEKEDPAIKNEGWLHLFIKNSGNRSNELVIPNLRKKNSERTIINCEQETRQIDSPIFDILFFEQSKVHSVIRSLFSLSPLFNESQQVEKYKSFISSVKKQYQQNQNDFHNFMHAINVMHMAYIFMKQEKSQELLSEIDILSLLIGSLCHDMGHIGTTNEYQINKFSKIALSYNDILPLQNSSASKCLKLLQKNNFITSLSPVTMRVLKNSIVVNILSTDSSKYSSIFNNFMSYKNFSAQKQLESSHFLTSFIIHAAQYSSYMKPSKIAQEWSAKLFNEMSKLRQKDPKFESISLGVYKDALDFETWLQDQKNFNSKIVIPLYSQLIQFYESPKSLMVLLQADSSEQLKETKKKGTQKLLLEDI